MIPVFDHPPPTVFGDLGFVIYHSGVISEAVDPPSGAPPGGGIPLGCALFDGPAFGITFTVPENGVRAVCVPPDSVFGDRVSVCD